MTGLSGSDSQTGHQASKLFERNSKRHTFVCVGQIYSNQLYIERSRIGQELEVCMKSWLNILYV